MRVPPANWNRAERRLPTAQFSAGSSGYARVDANRGGHLSAGDKRWRETSSRSVTSHWLGHADTADDDCCWRGEDLGVGAWVRVVGDEVALGRYAEVVTRGRPGGG